MGGWGQPHEPSPSPAATTGTSRQIADAVAALGAVGVTGDNLATAALAAAGAVDRLRHLLTRLLCESAGGERFAIHDEVARTLNELTRCHCVCHGNGGDSRVLCGHCL